MYDISPKERRRGHKDRQKNEQTREIEEEVGTRPRMNNRMHTEEGGGRDPSYLAIHLGTNERLVALEPKAEVVVVVYITRKWKVRHLEKKTNPTIKKNKQRTP